MKKVLGIIGMGLFAGAIVYVLFNKKDKTKNNVETEHPESASNDTNAPPIVIPNDMHVDGSVLDDIKVSAAKSMNVRHEEAAKIMKDAVDIICSKTEVSDNEIHELNDISNELDELLSEE